MTRWLPAVMAIAALLGCGRSTDNSGAATRSTSKATCAEARLMNLPDGVEQLDRELVPLGPELLSVVTTFGGEGVAITVVSGGFFDDILEAFDDLLVTGSVRVRDEEATVLVGSLLDEPVGAAMWREADQAPPCDAHAVVSLGLEAGEFQDLLTGVE